MERLTRTSFEDVDCEPYVYGGVEYYGDSWCGEVIDKLAQYEDTGLTPNGIIQLQVKNNKLKSKLSEMQIENTKLRENKYQNSGYED